MSEPNERIVIELSPEGRMRLSSQILRRMKEMGFTSFRYDALDLGFHLPTEWPDDPAVEITHAQLVVLATKLNMRLTIADANLSPMPAATHDHSNLSPCCILHHDHPVDGNDEPELILKSED